MYVIQQPAHTFSTFQRQETKNISLGKKSKMAATVRFYVYTKESTWFTYSENLSVND